MVTAFEIHHKGCCLTLESQVVPLKQLTLEELAEYAGSDPSKPLYLAIKGTIFDVSKGRQFYGPDGTFAFLRFNGTCQVPAVCEYGFFRSALHHHGTFPMGAGVYPFAGKECARALALMSTEEADCCGNLEGLGFTELDILRDWEAKFNLKYPVVGTVVSSK